MYCWSFVGLPDEHGRLQILDIHTATMKENDKMDADVDIVELAAITKNFSGAEIEGLVRAATSTAMNRLIKVSCMTMKRSWCLRRTQDYFTRTV